MASLFQSNFLGDIGVEQPPSGSFLGNEFILPDVGIAPPQQVRFDGNQAVFPDLFGAETVPLSEINTSPIDLFSPGTIDPLVFSPPLGQAALAPTTGTDPLGLDAFGTADPNAASVIDTPSLTAQESLDLFSQIDARDVFSLGRDLFTGNVPGLMARGAGIFGPEARGATRGAGRMVRGLGLLGIPGLGLPLGALQIGRGLFDVVGAVIPGIRDDINNLTFDTFGFDLFDTPQSAFRGLTQEQIDILGTNPGFGTADLESLGIDPSGLDLGTLSGLTAADFDPDFGDFGFDVSDAEAAAAGFESGVGDSGGDGESAGGTGSGGDTGGADSEGEGEAESGGGDSDF